MEIQLELRKAAVLSDSQKEQERIFSEAIKLPREQQIAFVQAECGPDDLLREEIELLLASHQHKFFCNYIDCCIFDWFGTYLLPHQKFKGYNPDREEI